MTETNDSNTAGESTTSGTGDGFGVCPDCRKPYIYVGDVFEGTDWNSLICACYKNVTYPMPYPNPYVTPPPVQQNGWVCPKCGRVYSPSTSECWTCNRGSTFTSANT